MRFAPGSGAFAWPSHPTPMRGAPLVGHGSDGAIPNLMSDPTDRLATDAPRRLLRLLNNGRARSEGDLAAHIDRPRAEVIALLGQLQGLGVDLAREGPRWRLRAPRDWLDPERLRQQLRVAGWRLDTLAIPFSVESTNDSVRALQGPWAVCLAEHQSRGRGRRGRAWTSPPGGNLYLSLRRDGPSGAHRPGALTLSLGLAAAEALRAATGVAVGVKWPNDLVVADRKLGGLLVEQIGATCQIVGLGLNISLPAEAGESIHQPWIDLVRASGREAWDRHRLAAGLLDALGPVLAEPVTGLDETARMRWSERDIGYGQPVRILQRTETLTGIAWGVTETGALRLQTAHGWQTIEYGEVSLRLAP